jgi:hypothetical protein
LPEEAGDRVDATQVSERGLGAQTFDVFSCADQELAGMDGTDAEQREGARCGALDQGTEMLVEGCDLRLKQAHPAGDAA